MRMPRLATVSGRAVIVVPAVVLLFWFSVTVTGAAVLSRTDPDLAMRFDGSNSRALEQGAIIAASQGTPAAARRAVALGTRALIASPLSSEGAAALGVGRSLLSGQGDDPAAFRYSQFLSRRTTFTQIWAIEHAVAQGDIRGALIGYDRLFRTKDYYRGQFMPVLLAASAQPEVARQVAVLLRERRPPWLGDYYGGLLTAFPGPENFALIVEAIRFDPADAEQAKLLRLALDRLVDSGRPDLAFGLYRRAVGPAVAGQLLRNGSFDSTGGIPPFDWDFAQGDVLLAEIGVDDAGAPALRLFNKGGQQGAMARQLLMLRPGRYRLSFAVGDVTGEALDRPSLTVGCLKGADLLSVSIPAAPARGRLVEADLAVPATGCAAQWLIVAAGNPVDASPGQQPWLGRMRLVPLADAPRPLADHARRTGRT